MTKQRMSIDSASPDRERLVKYKTFAVAFSYPDDGLFKFFPNFLPEKEKLCLEYDRLFRSNEVWLYGAEYSAENEFQRVRDLADINGFYRAFGLETDRERPDFLSCELEFMHYLIYKELLALKRDITAKVNENASICLDAQKKFFSDHLYPLAKSIAKRIFSYAKNKFYREAAQEMLAFLESEKKLFKVN